MSFGSGRGTRGVRMAAGGTGPRGGRGFGMARSVTPIPRERRGTTIRRILAFFGPYRLQVSTVLVAIVVTSLVGLINPFLLKLLIDDVFTAGHFQNLDLYVGLMIVLPIANGLIGLGQTYLSNSVGQHVMQDLRDALYVQLQRMPLRFFTETRTGEIQSRLANDVGGVQSVVTDTATSVVANAATIISTIVAMILIDWRLTLLSLGLMPFFLYLTYRVGKVRRTVSTDVQEALADMSAINEETLSVSGMLLTKTFGQQQAATDRFRNVNVRLGILQLRQSMVGRWFFMIVGTVFSITPALVYWLAGMLHGAPDAPTIGDIVAFTTLQSRLFFPLGQMLSVQVEVQGALALFDRIFEYLDMEPEIVDAPDAIHPDPETVRGQVRYAHASFRYPSAPPVAVAPDAEVEPADVPPEAAEAPPEPSEPPEPFGLEDIDFEMRPGELVALVGPSGSGKTTTTYLLPRLYDVNDGAVEIDGVDVRKIALASLGRIIGVVTQETYLFHASIRDNLRYAQGRRDGRGAGGGGSCGRHPRAHPGAAGGLRHARRRTRLQAVGRREAAHRDRARAPQGPSHPHPRRGDVSPRHRQRAAHPGRPGPRHGRSHDAGHRPPPVDDPGRGPHPGLPARAHRGARHASPAARPRRPLRAAVPRAVPERRCPEGRRRQRGGGGWGGRVVATAPRHSASSLQATRSRARPRLYSRRACHQ